MTNNNVQPFNARRNNCLSGLRLLPLAVALAAPEPHWRKPPNSPVH